MSATRFVLLAAVVLRLTCIAPGQCVLQPSAGLAQPQLSGTALCSTVWDPDGPGPLGQRLVVGGQDLIAGSVLGTSLMTWDGSTWATLGGSGPVSAYVDALTVWNGQLVAGGWNSVGPHWVMVWNGSAWQPLGGSFAQGISELVVWNGSLVAVEAGTFPAFAIHRWDGATWTALPTPPSLRRAFSAVSYQGLLCVGGSDLNVTAGVLERWNGTSWLPSITATNYINSLAVRPALAFGGTDTLYVGGFFSSIGGTAATNIAATSGGSTFAWLPLGAGLPSLCLSLTARNNGTLAGEVVASTWASVGVGAMAKWSSVGFGNPSWSAMGSAYLGSITYHAGAYHGLIGTAGDAACLRYQGSAWVPVANPGLDGQIVAATRSGPDVIVGGTFTSDGTSTLNGIATWNGTTFAPLGAGITGTSVDTLRTLANGDVVAGGSFTAAGGTSAANAARWSGGTWSSLGSGTNGQVLALAQLQGGDVIAAGKFTVAGGVPCARIARWNGTSWSPLGAGMNGDVLALAVRSDGVLFAGGAFTTAGGVACGRIAQWNGSTWSALGFGCNGDVHGLAVRPNDDVVAVGAFTTVNGLAAARCARWMATGWASMNAGSNDPAVPRSVLALPNGDVVAGRGFHEGNTSRDTGISRWNGTSWSSPGFAFATANGNDSVSVRAMTLRANGDLVVCGTFNTAGNLVASRLAVVSTTCAASATSVGTGCNSSVGPLTITADALPWIGAPFRTTTAGVAPGSLCLGVIGLSQLAIPLSALLLEGQPGCSLLAALDILLFAPNGPGNTATTSFALGNDPALIGVPFVQQTIPFEFDALGAVTAVRGSNALSLVIGTL